MAKEDNKPLATVYHYDVYGKRDEKYDFLSNNSIDSIEWTELENKDPEYFFVPKDFAEAESYNLGFGIGVLFPVNNVGIATGKDKELVAFDSKIIENLYQMQSTKYFYRPFDTRYTIFNKKILQRARYDTMKHLMKNNLALQATSKNRQLSLGYFFISNSITDRHLLDSAADSMSSFPLYLYPEKSGNDMIAAESRTPNLNTEIVNEIAEKIGLTFTDEKEEAESSFAPIDILDYIYAVLHSPTYREKYKEFLKIDFPRIPYPATVETFRQLVEFGGELRQIHLLESPKVNEFITSYPKDGDNKVTTKISKKDWELFDIEKQLGRIWINDEQYFDNIPLVAWEFYIGGYQPAQKWLKDRKERTLNYEDVLHYQKIIVALCETDRIMKEIDGIVELSGL